MTDVEKNIIFSVDKENEEKIVVNKSIFIGIIRKVENREEILKFIQVLLRLLPNIHFNIGRPEVFEGSPSSSKNSSSQILYAKT